MEFKKDPFLKTGKFWPLIAILANRAQSQKATLSFLRFFLSRMCRPRTH